jgi:hypothetical protein
MDASSIDASIQRLVRSITLDGHLATADNPKRPHYRISRGSGPQCFADQWEHPDSQSGCMVTIHGLVLTDTDLHLRARMYLEAEMEYPDVGSMLVPKLHQTRAREPRARYHSRWFAIAYNRFGSAPFDPMDVTKEWLQEHPATIRDKKKKKKLRKSTFPLRDWVDGCVQKWGPFLQVLEHKAHGNTQKITYYRVQLLPQFIRAVNEFFENRQTKRRFMDTNEHRFVECRMSL